MATFAISFEGQIKNFLNVLDTVNVVNIAKVDSPELFFIEKRKRISQAVSVMAQVDDITLQVIYEGK